MTDLFSKLEVLQGGLPDTSHTYKPLTAPQYDALENQIYRMGPQIDGTPAWPQELMLEWLQEQTPHIRGIAIAMMRRVYWPERVGLPPLPQALLGRKKVLKQINKSTPNLPMIPLLSADGRAVGKRHMVDSLAPVNIDQSGTIRCANSGRTLWIAPDSPTDRANPGTAEQLNSTYKAALHHVVADHRS